MRKVYMIIFLLIFLVPIILLAQTSTNVGVTINVSNPPQIQSITLYSDDDGGTTTTTTTLTPNDEMTLKIVVFDDDINEQNDKITRVVVTFYYGATEPTSTSPDEKAVYTIDIQDGSISSITIDDGITDPTYSDYKWKVDTTYSRVSVDTVNELYTVILVFTPSKIARYSDTGDWHIKVEATDSVGATGSAVFSNYDCSDYFEISVTPTSISAFLAPDDQIHLLGSITVTVIANKDFNLQFSATNWQDQSGNTIDLDTIKLYVDDDSNYVGDGSDSTEYQVTSTIGPTGGWGSFLRSTWDSTIGQIVNSQITIYLFVQVSPTVSPGQYQITLTIYVNG